MLISDLSATIALLIALSVAAERLVEIIKGLIPWLEKEKTDEATEGRRKAALLILSVFAGLLTAWLASHTGAVADMTPDKPHAWIALGFLSSGGSAFWNSILTYVNKVKDLKKHEAEEKKIETGRKKAG
jgi:hypothetical protein